MANIHIERQHTLGLEAAKHQVETIAQNLQREMQADYQWEGNRLVFKRSGASGVIDVGEASIVVDIKLNVALGLMKGKIEDGINRNLDRVLAV